VDARKPALEEMIGDAWAWQQAHPSVLRRLSSEGRRRRSASSGLT
jgi:3-methyladenine DNA glycosylase AlkC